MISDIKIDILEKEKKIKAGYAPKDPKNIFAARIQQPEEKLDIKEDAAQVLKTLQKSLEKLEAQAAKVSSIRQLAVSEFQELCHQQVSTLFNDQQKVADAPAQKYTYRRSSLYFDPPKFGQTINFPEHPNFEIPITEIWGSPDGDRNFLRFVLQNQEKTAFDNRKDLVQNTFEPDAVRRVLLHYVKKDDSFDSACGTVELFDKNDQLIQQCGKPDLDWAKERHEIKLEENERLVGVVCSTI